MLSDARQEFLLACALHNVIASESVQRILGEQATMDISFEGRLNRQQIVEDCKGNPQRIDQLAEKTQAFDGNSATRVEAITQVGVPLEICYASANQASDIPKHMRVTRQGWT